MSFLLKHKVHVGYIAALALVASGMFMYHKHVVNQRDLLRDKLSVCNIENDMLVSLNNAEFVKFQDTILTLNTNIDAIRQSAELNNENLRKQIKQYDKRVNQLKYELESYEKQFDSRPVVNTCEGGFDLIMSELRKLVW